MKKYYIKTIYIYIFIIKVLMLNNYNFSNTFEMREKNICDLLLSCSGFKDKDLAKFVHDSRLIRKKK